LNIPVVVTAWGSDVLLVPNKSWMNKLLVQSVLKNAAVITADADSMIDAINSLTAPLKKEIHSIQIRNRSCYFERVKRQFNFLQSIAQSVV